MVKKLFLFITLLHCLCSLALAAEFTATIDRGTIALNQKLVLRLRLVDASPKSSPDFSGIRKVFDILGTSRSTRSQWVNGQSSSLTEWQMSLAPKKIGSVSIPSISVKTGDGVLKTKQLAVKIKKAKPTPAKDEKIGVFIENSVSRKKPYKYEPFIYSVKLYTADAAENIRFEPLKLEDVSVKQNGSHSIYLSEYKGVEMNVIEVSYIITPLKHGPITIPKLKISGMHISMQGNRFDGIFGSFFGNQAQGDLFTRKSREFLLQSKEIKLDIQPPQKGATPWLPAQSISLKESLSSDEFRVGMPITRSITTIATGLTGKQLPEGGAGLRDNGDFQIYSETPEFTNNIKGSLISSSRKDTYSIIPQKAGEITLPVIRLKWWNVLKSRPESASVPARTIKIAPSRMITAPEEDKAGKPGSSENAIKIGDNSASNSAWGFGADGGFANVLAYLFLAIFGAGGVFLLYHFVDLSSLLKLLQKFRLTPVNSKEMAGGQAVLAQGQAVSDIIAKPAIALKDIDSVSSARELYEFLNKYAHYHFQTPSNSSLGKIFASMEKSCADIKEEQYKNIIQKLEDSLYAGKEIDLASVRLECAELLKLAKKKQPSAKKRASSELPKLNP
ncbi:MAG: hypothetical protein COA94_06580 [Rickettsiales bacterium]|nr:MAG: hypothetical protein COA94_06580 [Rickettsiales bacterium]